ncbi:MAG TPA: NAD(P)(+) transhydrogenase (Re/Si-specific) subunit beta [Firmicutes bacterium]|nr:NAD(P)(+) transhydrogenase (Re/Si-specific) subunit beta [Bacillota bacterium]
MSITIALSILIVVGFLASIHLMQSPETAVRGNRLGTLCMAVAILLVLWETETIFFPSIWVLLAASSIIGILLGQLVTMIQMPQTIALLNGLGGAASALVSGAVAAYSAGGEPRVFWFTAALALGLGVLTLVGSIVATLKLQGWISQRPVFVSGHNFFLIVFLLAGALLLLAALIYPGQSFNNIILPVTIVIFTAYGLLMSIRVGGADMPIIISFFNSLSGVATSVCGLTVFNFLLTGVGALVGVAGMILTQIMCRAMNRNLPAVLGGIKAKPLSADTFPGLEIVPGSSPDGDPADPRDKLPIIIKESRKVIIVPGYGMAVAQAQQAVKDLIDTLQRSGKELKIAIHPVAGRMPGHMNVLLAEVGIPYDMLFDIEAINPEFESTDLVIAVGACDVINPAANTAEGTPIYGMPVLEVAQSKHVVVCNLDSNPGYSGVPNTLYQEKHTVTLWGDALDTVPKLTALINDKG